MMCLVDFSFCLKPVGHVMSVFSTTRLVQFVGATGDSVVFVGTAGDFQRGF
jgi:hypothetical protein